MPATTAAHPAAAEQPLRPRLGSLLPGRGGSLPWAQRWERFWVARHPRADHIQLHHGNVYILPTAAGWIFALTLAVLLLASINYQLNLGYMLTFLLGGSAVVSMHMTHRTLRGLALHLREPAPVHAGEAATLEAVLTNAATRERLALGLRIEGPAPATEPAPDWTWVDVPAVGSATVHLSVPALQRGRHGLPRITIHTRFPFGLFRAWSIWRPAAQMLVWPRPEQPAPPLPFGVAPTSGQQPSRPQAGDDTDGVRDWRRGDPLRLIAWKKSSRTLASQGTLVSRDRESRMRQDVWMDWDQAAPLPDEARLSRLTAWIWRADRGADAYGLRLPGTEVPPGQGDGHRLHCLEALALWQAK